MVGGARKGLCWEPKLGCADEEVLCDSALLCSWPLSSFGSAGPQNEGPSES